MDYKKMYEDAQEALRKAMVEALGSADDEALKKVEHAKKVMEECQALMERDGSKAPVSKPAVENLSETQKFVKNLCEAVALGSTFSNKIPNEMANAIQRKKEEVAKLRGYCTVHKATGDYTVLIEGDDVTVAYVSEGSAISDSTPSVAPLKLAALKLAALVRVSNEYLADLASADVEAFLVEKIGKAFAKKEDLEILSGSGSSAMTGIITTVGTSGNYTQASGTAPTWAEVKGIIETLAGYRDNAKLVMTRATGDAISLFTDSNGSYIFPQNVELKSILGCEIIYVDSMPSGYYMVGGDFSYYHILDRKDLEITTLRERYAEYDQTGIRAVERIDGAPALADAFCVYKTKA